MSGIFYVNRIVTGIRAVAGTVVDFLLFQVSRPLQASLLLFTSLSQLLLTLSDRFLHGVSAVACVPDFIDVTAVAGFSIVA
jgi:hypothetical protein